ncbi:MAG: DUF4214 domain-containing protein [Burkholderiales bacterium]|nr:DUF4214 domain-containing protein [Burkholderiales bacterium]
MSDITPLLTTGPSAQRVDIVFLAEGYQAAERDKFLSDARKFLDYMLSPANSKLNQPFADYHNYFNANALFFASKDSGLDLLNSKVDTYFDSAQHGADGRMVFGDAGKVKTAIDAALVPNASEMRIVLINSDTYGGTGGEVAWVTAGNAKSADAVLHEFGHTFAGLQDEYVEQENDRPIDELISVHLTNDLKHIPWKNWLGFTDELGTVGIYEGGLYHSKGVWRATQESKMKALGYAFNAPQKEAFALAYYQTMGDYLSLDASIPGLVQAYAPDTNLLSFTWGVNGKTSAPSSSNFLDLYAQHAYSNGNTIAVTSVDNTGYIRTDLQQTLRTKSFVLNAPQATEVTTSTYLATQSNTLFHASAINNRITFADSANANYVDGAAGIDVINLPNTASAYSISKLGSSSYLLQQNGLPKFALHDIEYAHFADKTVDLATLQALDDNTAPNVQILLPEQDANNADPHAPITIQFSEAIFGGKGKLTVADINNVAIETFTADSGKVEFSANTLTLHPSYDLPGLSEIHLVLEHGSVSDASGNEVNLGSAYSFKTAKNVDGNLIGSAANDSMLARAANDHLSGLGGNDTLDGGMGRDTAVFNSPRAANTITIDTTNSNATVAGPEGTDSLHDIERLQFNDQIVALDINGNAGQCYRLFQAAFNRKPDNDGLKYWIGRMDSEANLTEVASAFVSSSEFQAAGNFSNAQFVGKLYENVLHRTPDASGLAYWANQLNIQQMSKPQVLAGFSESMENKINVIGSIEHGIAWSF